MKILLALRDPLLCQTLAAGLRARDHVVECDDSGQDLSGYVAGGYCDAIVIDPGFPAPCAVEVIRALVRADHGVPVFAVGRSIDPVTLVAALRAGADDVLALPIGLDELEVRLVTRTCRLRGHARTLVAIGPLTLDLLRRRVIFEGRAIALTRTEFAVFEALALRPGRVLSKDALMALLYEGPVDLQSRIIDAWLFRVRARLRAVGAGDLLQNVWGQGWFLALPAAASQAA